MTITVNGCDAEPGCYIAGHHGQYALDELGSVAEQFDIELDDDDDPRYWRAASEAETAEDSAIVRNRVGIGSHLATPEECMERQVWAADKVEEILNDHTEGGAWTWQDGEFFLVRTPTSSEVDLDDINCDTIVAEIIDVLINDGEEWSAETIEHVAEALTSNGVPAIWEEAFEG